MDSLCLTATVGTFEIAIPVSDVKAVRKGVDVVRVPRSPSHIVGTVDMCGQWMALVDLRRVFGLRSSHEETSEVVEQVAAQAAAHQAWLDGLLADGPGSEVSAAPSGCTLAPLLEELVRQRPRSRMLVERIVQDHDALHQAVASALALDSERARKALSKAHRRQLTRLRVVLDRLQFVLDLDQQQVAVAVRTDSSPVAVHVDMVQRVEPAEKTDDPKGDVVRLQSGAHAVLLDLSRQLPVWAAASP
ncbi:MAG: chemotaxis protein CheW [Myxococcales bacterium]|nr:chemotaxis protein CheW [Myxococcales bacterium]